MKLESPLFERARGSAAASPASRTRRAVLPAGLASVCAVLFAACGGGGGGSPTGVDGDIVFPEGIEASPGGVFSDPNFGGNASNFLIAEMFWGRLVDVFDRKASGVQTRQFVNFVIGEDIVSDGTDFLLTSNPITQRERLTILHDADDPQSGFQAAFDRLDDNLGPVLPKGVAPSEIPPFSFVARNAALVVRFNDLIDQTSVTSSTVRLQVGYPPIATFPARVIPDGNFGGTVSANGQTEFRTTRLIFDVAVTQLEAAATDPPLPVNALGLPPSITTAAPNVALVVPTTTDTVSGQFDLFTNASGKELSVANNGPVDLSSPTLDVVRSFRSGGVPQDDFNGFLRDEIRPRIVGAQPITVGFPTPAGANRFTVDVTFASGTCAAKPDPGDIIELSGVFLQVVSPAPPPDDDNLVPDVLVEVIAPDPETPFFGGQGLFRTGFDPANDATGCFVTFLPEPGAFPNVAVDPSAEIIVRFSEPIDPDSVTAVDSVTVRRVDPGPGNAIQIPLRERVVGRIAASTDLKEYRFQPVLPFSHQSGTAEDYNLEIISSALEGGVVDLAGNFVAATLGVVPFALDPSAPTALNGGFVLAFDAADEDGNGNPEVRGEFVQDTDRGVIQPRPVTRFGLPADRNNPVPGIMPPSPQPGPDLLIATVDDLPCPVQPGPDTFGGTPDDIPCPVNEILSPSGSRVMTLYRYFDLGLDLEDQANYNLDVERLYWAPRSGQVALEFFPQFEMRLSHSARFPDEGIDLLFVKNPPCATIPCFPGSGLVTSGFSDNVLSDPVNQFKVVHPRGEGYQINPINTFAGASGTSIHPYPLNGEGPIKDFVYYTWRDTAIQNVGGADNCGLPSIVEIDAGVPVTTGPGGLQGPGVINSIGLPLLMEFRCFSTGATAFSVNAFDTNLATAFGPPNVPFFRLFSAGGITGTGSIVNKDPDAETVPTGGTVPAPNPPGGPPVSLSGSDAVFYIGQVDFVIRISRVFSIFFDSGDANVRYLQPFLTPITENQPAGTQIVLAYRGATQVGAGTGATTDATVFDSYGDVVGTQNPPPTAPGDKNGGILFKNGNFRWSSNINDVEASQFLQVRMTFINNPATGLSPELSAIGIPFQRQ